MKMTFILSSLVTALISVSTKTMEKPGYHVNPIDRENRKGSTPFHELVHRGLIEVVQEAVNRNPDLLKSTNATGQIALHTASFKGRTHNELLRWPIDQDPTLVDHADKTGKTPLHLAAFKGREQAAQLLIKSGAKIDRANHGGRTPLHCAAFSGCENIIRLLLLHGADRTVKNKFGESPYQLATNMRHMNIAALLQPLPNPQTLDVNNSAVATKSRITEKSDAIGLSKKAKRRKKREKKNQHKKRVINNLKSKLCQILKKIKMK